MAQLNHTGEQLDEAIALVLAGYADVSQVNAIGPDVRAGCKVVAANGSVFEGTMPNATLTQLVRAVSSFLTDEETDAEIEIQASADPDEAGYVSSGVSRTVKKYIRTQQKTVSQATLAALGNIVLPDAGCLLSKVTVQLTPANSFYFGELIGSVLGNTATDYPVTANMEVTFVNGGTVTPGQTFESSTTLYIQVENITVNANGSYSASAGKLIRTVTVNIPDASLAVSADVSGFVGDHETDAYIDVTPKAEVNTPGIVSRGATGQTQRVYIDTSDATFTENGTYPHGAAWLYGNVTVNVPRAKLNAPSVSIAGRVVTFHDGNNGTFCDSFNVVLDGVPYAGYANTGEPISCTLPEMEIGQHTVQVYADGAGIDESDPGEVIYNVQAFMTVDGKYFKTADGKFFVVKTQE